MPEPYRFTPNYSDWPLATVGSGEREAVRAALPSDLVAYLERFARTFQESFDEATGGFRSPVTADTFRATYESLARRLRDSGLLITTSYWWEDQPGSARPASYE